MSNRSRSGAIVKLVIWSIVLVIFVSILAAAIVLDRGRFEGLGGFFTIISGYTYPNSDEYAVGDMVYSEDIQKIDIEWVAGSVTICIHTGDEIKLEESSSGVQDENRMRTRIKDGTLYVKYAESGIRIAKKIPSKELILYLPLKYAASLIDEIKIESVSADIFINKSANALLCRNLDIENVSGDTYIAEMTAKQVSIEGVSGKISVSGVFDEIDISAVSAAVDIALEGNTESVDVETVSGDVDLLIPDMGFKAELDTVSGQMRFKSENVGKVYTYGDGISNFEFDTVSADVRITISYEWE